MSRSTRSNYPEGITAVSSDFELTDTDVVKRHFRAIYSDGRSEEITEERYNELAKYPQA